MVGVGNPGIGLSGEMGPGLDSNPCSTKGSWQRTQYCENMKDNEFEKYITYKDKMETKKMLMQGGQ
jgi:hypothetical protein